MTEEQISFKLELILRSLFPRAKFNMSGEITANDVLGWDSLTHAQFIIAVEEEFQIRVPLKEVTNFNRLSDMIQYIHLHT